jgi:uncharacterized protein YndB with AHSA1/START domain
MKLDFERNSTGHRMDRVASSVGVRIDRVRTPWVPVPSERARQDGQRARTIQVRDRYDAPPRRIFDAWLDPKIAGRWLFATASAPMTRVSIDARVGGSFRFAIRQGATSIAFAGRYLEIVPHRRLVFTVSEPRPAAASRVTVTIAPHGAGSALELIHEHLPGDEAAYLEDRWTGILYGLGVTLDSLVRRSTTVGSPR